MLETQWCEPPPLSYKGGIFSGSEICMYVLYHRILDSLFNTRDGAGEADWKTWRCTSYRLVASLACFSDSCFKKGLTASPNNYRPISLTSVCCRLMERIINSELLSYLYQHGLKSKCQHGFLHKHSTCRPTNLLESVHDWSIALNNKQITDVIYIRAWS